MSEQKKQEGGNVVDDKFGGAQEFVTFVIADQLFGIPVLTVQDVLNAHQITPKKCTERV